MAEGLEFDPGFAPYVLAFRGSAEYIYNDMARFKNFSQRKLKFRQHYKKLLELFNNNLGFYIGCLMWAAYIKTCSEQEILNNNCFGQKYDEASDLSEPVFMIQFLELFPKDMRYYLGEDWEFDSSYSKILEMYKEFLIINKGFVNSKTNTDILLPQDMKTKNAKTFKKKIESILETKDLSKFSEYKKLLL